MNYLRHILLLLAATLCALCATADCVLPPAADAGDALTPDDSTQWCRLYNWGKRCTEKAVVPLSVKRDWLFGAGGGSIYDAYLSPLDYTGPLFSVGMQNERNARWNPRVTSLARFDLSGTYATNPGRNAHFYDGQLDVGFGWAYNWERSYTRSRSLTLALGGMADFSGGGTYSTRNGNNPAQGRAAFSISPVLRARYTFTGPRGLRLKYGTEQCEWRESDDTWTTRFLMKTRTWSVEAQLELPLVGVMFSPQYGQSYYELFSLHHFDHNVCPTWPGNAPSARLLTTLHMPVSLHTDFILGYRGEALQSHVNGLRRHAWQNGVVIGFTRHLNL